MNASTAAVAAFVVAGLVFGSFYVGSQMISRPPASIATPRSAETRRWPLPSQQVLASFSRYCFATNPA